MCSQTHREVVYAFPSPVMLRPALAKAIADRARCILVVPVSIIVPHWHKLLAASVLSSMAYPDGFLLVRRPLPLLLHVGSYRLSELAIFECDFGRLSPREGLPAPSDCPGARLHRPRPPCCSHADFGDRSRLRERLLALHQPAPFPPPNPPPPPYPRPRPMNTVN